MKLSLRISEKAYQQINLLLDHFLKTEWSGPAFFRKIEQNDLGWSDTWELVDFWPIDVGTHGSTEWEGKTFIKESRKLYKQNPKLQECFMGNIHSHHGMGAFFSGTDVDHLEEAANQVGYPSLVVASAKDLFAFAISYIDNFGNTHVFEADKKEIHIDVPMEVDAIFLKQVKKIKAKAKRKPKITTGYSYYGQNSLFSRPASDGKGKGKSKGKSVATYIDFDGAEYDDPDGLAEGMNYGGYIHGKK